MITVRVSVSASTRTPHLGEVAMHRRIGGIETALGPHGDDQDPVLGAIEPKAGK